MRKSRIAMTAAVLAVATASSPAVFAKGTPQRAAELPPGLAKVIEKMTPGILNALARTQGSNSRLQDLPVSP